CLLRPASGPRYTTWVYRRVVFAQFHSAPKLEKFGRAAFVVSIVWNLPCSYRFKLALCDDLSEFDQVAGRVCEEGKPAADGVEFERLGHDLDAAGSKVSNGLLDIRHVDTEVVIAGIAETIAQVRVDGSVNRQRIASTQQFDQEFRRRARSQELQNGCKREEGQED